MEEMTVKQISECYLKPKYDVMESEKPHYLAPLDLIKLSSRYIQKGLLFTKPSQSFSILEFLQGLKESLSLTLVHFYPFAGQLATRVDEANHECLIYVDCKKGPGVRFIHATLDTMTISNILSPIDVPLVVDSFFDHHKAFNHDGHTRPLLSVQVTELLDGVFIGCSANHAVVDGTSYWEFWNMWSEIHMSNGKVVSNSRLPVFERWFPDGFGEANPVLFPFTHPDEFISCVEPSQLRIRFFHFTSKSIQSLKAEANQETGNSNISSFQALSALVWRSVIRSNRVSHNQVTNFRLTANNRHRLDPPLPKHFFGNCVSLLKISTTAGELLENSLGWTAALLNKSIVNHNDKDVTDSLKAWLEVPSIPIHGIMYDSNSLLSSSSPRFDMYGNEFGLGKAIAVRSGYANKFQGTVTAYPGSEGGGSVDLEICLSPDSMTALESDVEFMAAVTLH